MAATLESVPLQYRQSCNGSSSTPSSARACTHTEQTSLSACRDKQCLPGSWQVAFRGAKRFVRSSLFITLRLRSASHTSNYQLYGLFMSVMRIGVLALIFRASNGAMHSPGHGHSAMMFRTRSSSSAHSLGTKPSNYQLSWPGTRSLDAAIFYSPHKLRPSTRYGSPSSLFCARHGITTMLTSAPMNRIRRRSSSMLTRFSYLTSD